MFSHDDWRRLGSSEVTLENQAKESGICLAFGEGVQNNLREPFWPGKPARKGPKEKGCESKSGGLSQKFVNPTFFVSLVWFAGPTAGCTQVWGHVKLGGLVRLVLSRHSEMKPSLEGKWW